MTERPERLTPNRWHLLLQLYVSLCVYLELAFKNKPKWILRTRNGPLRESPLCFGWKGRCSQTPLFFLADKDDHGMQPRSTNMKRGSEVSGPLEKKTDSAGFKSYFLLEAMPGAAAAFEGCEVLYLMLSVLMMQLFSPGMDQAWLLFHKNKTLRFFLIINIGFSLPDFREDFLFATDAGPTGLQVDCVKGIGKQAEVTLGNYRQIHPETHALHKATCSQGEVPRN